MTTSPQRSELFDRVVAADKRHVWHPYTPMDRWIESTDPLVIVRAEGSRIEDVNGRRYLDANSSWWVAPLGHNHPALVAAMREQADKFCHVSLAGITHEPAAMLAEELCAIAPPGLTRVFYSDDGSTAVEAALKMALQYWHNQGRSRKRRFLALDGAFHGDTLGAVSLGGVEVFRRPFAGVLLDCVHVPLPEAGEAAGAGHERAFAALEQALADGADEIAALVLEPLLQGAAGMRVYDPELVRRARAACDAHDVLLVADEVFTGYGRTGAMWASSLATVAPDLLCVAKGFTSGTVPMAATLCTNRIFDAFRGEPQRAFWHGHSYCGNPLGAAIARAVLQVYRDERICEQSRPRAARIAEAFEQLGRIPGVQHPRALGMVAAVDLAAAPSYLGARGWRAYDHARRLGAYLRPLGDVVYIAPPLNISDADLEELLGIVRDSVVHALDV